MAKLIIYRNKLIMILENIYSTGVTHDNHLMTIVFIVDLHLCGWVLNIPNEKDRCVVLLTETVTLLTPFIVLIMLHFCYVVIFVLTLSPFLQTLCLSLILSLGLSSSQLSSRLSPSHIKMHGNLFSLSLIAIKLSD